MNTVQTNLCGRSFQPLIAGERVLIVTSPVIALEVFRSGFTPEQYQTFIGIFLPSMSGFALNERQGVLAGTVLTAGEERSPIGLFKLEASEGEILFETVVDLERVYAPLAKAYEGASTSAKKRARMREMSDLGAMLFSEWGDADKLEKDHPWIRYVNLSEEERAQMTAMASELGFAALLVMGAPTEGSDGSSDGEEEGFDKLFGLGADDDKNDATLSRLHAKMTAPSTDKHYLVLPDTSENRTLIERIWSDNLARLEKKFAIQAENLEQAKNHSCL